MQKSWLITAPPELQEIALTWTGNRTEVRSSNVHVQFLEPAQPVIKQRALIIKGANRGEVVIVEKRKRGGSKQVVMKLENSQIHLELPETALCRIADPK